MDQSVSVLFTRPFFTIAFITNCLFRRDILFLLHFYEMTEVVPSLCQTSTKLEHLNKFYNVKKQIYSNNLNEQRIVSPRKGRKEHEREYSILRYRQHFEMINVNLPCSTICSLVQLHLLFL